MKTQCNPKQLHFQGLGTRKVVGCFDGGTITSDAGVCTHQESGQKWEWTDSSDGTEGRWRRSY